VEILLTAEVLAEQLRADDGSAFFAMAVFEIPVAASGWKPQQSTSSTSVETMAGHPWNDA
jgi:hypothetical protein